MDFDTPRPEHPTEFLTAVQHQVRTLTMLSSGSEWLGPFLLHIDDNRPAANVNFAIPNQNSVPTPDDIRKLTDSFHVRDREPRLEFLAGWAPQAEAALLTAGFAMESRRPIMICARGELREAPTPEGVRLGTPQDDASFRAAAQVQHTAFGESGEVAHGTIEWMRRTALRGGGAAYARTWDGTVAGSGVYTTIVQVTELAGIAVSTPFRGHGIASAISSRLTAEAFRFGAEAVWLEPENPDAARLYARLGYHPFAEKLTLAAPGAS